MQLQFCFLTVAACLLSAGCHKKEAPRPGGLQAVNGSPTNAAEVTSGESVSAPDSAETGAAVPVQPLPPPPAPTREVVARAENNVRRNVAGDVDGFLTGELRNFVQQKKRMPQSFSEFATMRLDSVPRPPEGKKWVIDTETLEVKAVPAK